MNLKPVYAVLLLGNLHHAHCLTPLVGGRASAVVHIVAGGNHLDLHIEFAYGAVIEDSRMRAEATLRSFVRNDHKFAFYPPAYFSMWDEARLTTAPDPHHYLMQEPEFSVEKVRSGELRVEAFSRSKVPSLILVNPQRDAVFTVVDRGLMKELIGIHNGKVQPPLRITSDSCGFEFLELAGE